MDFISINTVDLHVHVHLQISYNNSIIITIIIHIEKYPRNYAHNTPKKDQNQYTV